MVIGQAAADCGWASVLVRAIAGAGDTVGTRSEHPRDAAGRPSTPGRKNGRLRSARNGGNGDGARSLVTGGSGRERVGGRDRGGRKKKQGWLASRDECSEGIRVFGFIKANPLMSQLFLLLWHHLSFAFAGLSLVPRIDLLDNPWLIHVVVQVLEF